MVASLKDWPEPPVAPKPSPFKGKALAIVGITAGIVGCIAGLTYAHPAPRVADSIPFCRVDRTYPDHVTVSGPAGGRIRTDGRDQGFLVSIADDDMGAEVADDAGSYSGILYNVEPGNVTVNGVTCR